MVDDSRRLEAEERIDLAPLFVPPRFMTGGNISWSLSAFPAEKKRIIPFDTPY